MFGFIGDWVALQCLDTLKKKLPPWYDTAVIIKIDSDNDGLITVEEMQEWIKQSQAR